MQENRRNFMHVLGATLAGMGGLLLSPRTHAASHRRRQSCCCPPPVGCEGTDVLSPESYGYGSYQIMYPYTGAIVPNTVGASGLFCVWGTRLSTAANPTSATLKWSGIATVVPGTSCNALINSPTTTIKWAFIFEVYVPLNTDITLTVTGGSSDQV